jgi:DNA mismatch repair protein MutS
MRQYKALKREAPVGSILLLSMGDFYEAFGEDAVILAPRFDTPLIMRGGVPMTGCHRFSLDTRMHSRFAGGLVFAIAEVMEDRHSHGGLLRREIVRIVNGGESEAAE